MKTTTFTLGLAAGLTLAAGAAMAEYPDRTINMLVPFGAGGGTDVPARFFAAEMEEIMGQNSVVSNVEGAGGTVGATQLSEADADGYNLGFLPLGTMTTQPHLRGTCYNNESWTPICMVSQGPFNLVVADDSPIETMDDFIAQANGDGLKFAGAGPGSMAHLEQLSLNNATGADSLYIPTGGGGEIATEINGGRADATAWFADFDSRFGWRALGIMSDQRSEARPDVPTMAELGYDTQVSVWFGFFTQAGTPDDVVATLSGACKQAVATDSFAENMAGANRLIRYMGSDEVGPFFNEAFELNGQLLKDAGLLK
ncbi:Bug family tripartite tricarboxylate transporter substrate binding protein [Pseudooctadecabacter jejudonensis]|uniref:Tripartite tricarboxylate transporter family receptor n=1 Tax=Pseudooctadecabacter jejudonensis TaxID=1391910 RepID=A0A1Y5SJT3_9RHOB|nr:tripartite tricarboxylate transporter substrate binding protein [Pseudooctadecabacter jejudonensis]SLN41240.1 Tripartite tricarboxylate transporter family receptor [Pseudooctadecabacter jejudonensis]